MRTPLSSIFTTLLLIEKCSKVYISVHVINENRIAIPYATIHVFSNNNSPQYNFRTSKEGNCCFYLPRNCCYEICVESNEYCPQCYSINTCKNLCFTTILKNNPSINRIYGTIYHDNPSPNCIVGNASVLLYQRNFFDLYQPIRYTHTDEHGHCYY